VDNSGFRQLLPWLVPQLAAGQEASCASIRQNRNISVSTPDLPLLPFFG